MAQVKLSNIVARYDSFTAVDDISLLIEAGQFVTLLGPSGCGKSTTLRIVAGLLQPTSGKVEFNGRDVTTLNASKRNIGMVFQSLALFPHMTVAENVAFGLRMKKVPSADIAKQVNRMLEIVHLAHLAERYPAQMSGGQQQRVALARALAISPNILILDEPFGALDRKLREAMQIELHAVTRELGITALFVTHDQEEALMLSDSIAVMNKGQVEQMARPEEIFSSPKTQFVADFIGVTNFLHGEIVDSDTSSGRIRLGDAIVTTSSGAKIPSGTSVRVAVRPEKIELSSAARSDLLCLSGRIRQITYHGHNLRYVIDLADREPLVAMVSGPRSDALAVGNVVTASWQPEDMHIFVI